MENQDNQADKADAPTTDEKVAQLAADVETHIGKTIDTFEKVTAAVDAVTAAVSQIAGDIAELKKAPTAGSAAAQRKVGIGTTVQYVGQKETAGADGVHAAIVTGIAENGSADLHILFRNSQGWFRTGVPQDSIPEGSAALGYWRWPE